MEASIRQITTGIAHSFGMQPRIDISHGVAGTKNTAAEAGLAGHAAETAGLPVLRDLPPSMAGEDFGWYLHEIPGAFVWIGNGPAAPGRELHSPNYDFKDTILPAAASYLATVAKLALQA
jgi:hippurate hydrolase